MTIRPVDAALRYARWGWAVFPCHETVRSQCSCGLADCSSPAKHPRTRRGLHDASTDPARVMAWWRRWPSANVGVRTGSVSGLVVVDVDRRPGGLVSLAKLEQRYGQLPATAAVEPAADATSGSPTRAAPSATAPAASAQASTYARTAATSSPHRASTSLGDAIAGQHRDPSNLCPTGSSTPAESRCETLQQMEVPSTQPLRHGRKQPSEPKLIVFGPALPATVIMRSTELRSVSDNSSAAGISPLRPSRMRSMTLESPVVSPQGRFVRRWEADYALASDSRVVRRCPRSLDWQSNCDRDVQCRLVHYVPSDQHVYLRPVPGVTSGVIQLRVFREHGVSTDTTSLLTEDGTTSSE